MNREEKIALVKELYQKYIYEDAQGIKSDRNKIKLEFEERTGEELPLGTLKSYIAELNREKLYEEKSFNERTDDIIDKPQKLYDPDDLIIAMGANPKTFEMDSTILNRWWLDKGDLLERIRNGQIKIRIKPKKFEITLEKIDELVNNSNIEPYVVDNDINDPYGLLEMTLTDMHFGKNTFEHYKPHLKKLVRWVKSQEWEEILLPIGNDLFHWDNVLGTTVAGTQVGFEPDLDTAWEDALKFYKTIIELSLEHCINLNIIYVPGNHDQTLAWAFAKMLEKQYPQAICDIRNDNYKIFTWEKIAIGLSHGNNPRQFAKYAPLFNHLFRVEFANAKVREIHLGDKHHQMVKDEFGMVTRGLSTASKTDLWHYNGGYVGASKSFQIFIYSKDAIEGMMFI